MGLCFWTLTILGAKITQRYKPLWLNKMFTFVALNFMNMIRKRTVSSRYILSSLDLVTSFKKK